MVAGRYCVASRSNLNRAVAIDEPWIGIGSRQYRSSLAIQRHLRIRRDTNPYESAIEKSIGGFDRINKAILAEKIRCRCVPDLGRLKNGDNCRAASWR